MAWWPSAGNLARQVGANLWEQSTAGIKSAGDMAYGLTGSEGIRNATHKMTDTTGIRSGGKLPTPEAPKISRGEALGKGLSEMQSPNLAGEIGEKQRKKREEEEVRRQADLKNFYPDLF